MKDLVGKTEQVYWRMRDEIIQGVYSRKERLIERELTKKFGVSKTPIREAFNRLIQEGLVDGNFNQGIYVKCLSLQDALDIYEIREVLEGLTARKAAENLTPQLSEKLESFLKRASGYIGNNMTDYYKLNVEFHNILKDSCNNSRLSEILDVLYHQNRALLSSSVNLPRRAPEKSFKEHKRIIAAILGKNGQLAEKMARRHLYETRKALLKYFQEQHPASGGT